MFFTLRTFAAHWAPLNDRPVISETSSSTIDARKNVHVGAIGKIGTREFTCELSLEQNGPLSEDKNQDCWRFGKGAPFTAR